MKRILSVVRRFVDRGPVKLDELPAQGLRASWFTDAEWRDALRLDLDGAVFYWPALFDRDVIRLSLALYRQGVFVLPPDATHLELLEGAVLRSCEGPARQTWVN